MKFNPLKTRNMRQSKNLIILVGILVLLVFELGKLILLDRSLSSVLFDSVFGLFIIILLTEVGANIGGYLQNQVLQEIERRELIENQLRLRSSALEAAANAIVITDPQGKIIWVNPAFTTLTGYTEAEVLGKSPSILNSGQHDRAFFQNLWQTIAAGRAWHGEIVNRRKDGRLYTEEQTITPVLDENGQVSHFIAIKLDITRRKQAEADLWQFAERLEAMHAIDHAILSRRSLEEMIEVALQQLRQIVPWQRACVVLHKPGAVEALTLHNDGSFDRQALTQFAADPALNLAHWNQVRYVPDLRQYEPSTGFIEVLRAAGIVSCLNIPLTVHTDETVGLLALGSETLDAFNDDQITIAQEIADSLAIALLQHRLYEAERQQREKAEVLQEIGAALSSTLDFDQVLALVVDLISRVLSSDAANIILIRGNFARIVHSAGYDKYGQVVASKVASLSFEVSQTPNLATILETKRPLIIDDVHNYPGWLHDKGVSHTRSWVGVPVFVQGEVTAVFALSKTQPNYYQENHIDLLQAFAAQVSLALDNAHLYEKLRAHAAELEDRVAERTHELAEANERLTELDRLKSKFISDISHELRTPITNMIVYLDLLEKGKPEKRDRYRQILRQETARLAHLIESIFDESRQTGHLRQTQYTRVDLNQVISEVTNQHRSQIEARNLELLCTLEPQLPAVFGDPSQLARVVTNLLVNAISYTPSGSIHIKTFSNTDNIHLQVEDTGVGIDEEDLPHLFERFYRGRNVSQSTIPGTGLGLGVVQEIVGLHHGGISVQNRPTGGALFDVRLPARMPLSYRTD